MRVYFTSPRDASIQLVQQVLNYYKQQRETEMRYRHEINIY